jgi:hypothetical protein
MNSTRSSNTSRQERLLSRPGLASDGFCRKSFAGDAEMQFFAVWKFEAYAILLLKIQTNFAEPEIFEQAKAKDPKIEACIPVNIGHSHFVRKMKNTILTIHCPESKNQHT